MTTRRRIWIASTSLVVTLGLLATVVCRAQPAPDPSLWSVAFNPSGQRVVPVVFYNSDTGILGIDTRGLNRISDTPNYTTSAGLIGGDDAGMIALDVFTPLSGGTFLPPFSLPFDPSQRLLWSASYFGQRYSIFGSGIFGGNEFLWPGVYPVIQMQQSLRPSDFRVVELAISFGDGRPGVRLIAQNNGVQFIPEPTSAWFAANAFCCIVLCRLKSKTFGKASAFSMCDY